MPRWTALPFFGRLGGRGWDEDFSVPAGIPERPRFFSLPAGLITGSFSSKGSLVSSCVVQALKTAWEGLDGAREALPPSSDDMSDEV